ncbi:MAG: protein disulfide oxidoreductase [Gammaproteobacteria bacterium]|nr:protein disulfide oxidoreductase [Gammaproteobacteria bacterium]
MKRRLLGWAFELFLLFGALYLLHLWQTRDTVTGEAPMLSGRTLNGEVLALESLRGRPVLVYFWATWCPICELESGTIDSLAEDYTVITIAMQSGHKTAIQAYLDENALSFPVISDPQGLLASRWGVAGVPTTFIIDAGGVIRFTEVGYTTSLGLRTRLWWVQ